MALKHLQLKAITKYASALAFSCEYCEIFENTIFKKSPPMAACGCCKITIIIYDFKLIKSVETELKISHI